MKKALERVLDAVELEDFYSEFLDGKVNGKDNLPCPFPDRHKKGGDSIPSFRVFLDTGGAFCHGCGYKCTTPVNFWADLKGIPFDRALRHLYSKFVEPLVPDDEYEESHKKLMSSPVVLDRLMAKRGITAETAARFKLGYDGMRLTIPIFNDLGWCVNIRRYDLYKNGGPKVISWKEGYGKARLFPLESLADKKVVVTEGELDTILGIQEGLNCVTPAGGAKTWKSEWNKLFKGKQVFVLPDNDAPGVEGAAARREEIAKTAASCRVISLPVKKEGEDLTDWLLKYGGNAADFWKLAKAEPEELPDAPTPKKAETGMDVLSGIDGVERSKTEALMVMRSEAMWSYLQQGGAFFKNSNGEMYYAREGMAAMHVASGMGQFMSFLLSKSPLINQATSMGKFIYNHITHKAFSDSALSKTAVWTMFDSGKLYVHAGKDKLLKLGDGPPHYIKNAINDERILLELPMSSMAIADLPAKSPVEGLRLLRELFMDNLAMQEEERYLLICWICSIFFRGWVKPKPIVRLLAKTASGKSTASKLVSTLLYGDDFLSHSASTVAATYEMSSKYPLVILDNLETRNMTPSLEDFLLVAATGGMKAKRQMSTDSGLIMQYTDSLVLTNGIEPFNRHELIDRTMEISLDLDKYGNPKFQEAKILNWLKKARPQIHAAILFLIYKYVLPRIKAGDVGKIMREFGSHGKERFNEYLAVMCLVLDAFWGYMPLDNYARPHDLVDYWLESQTHAEQRQDEGTNEVLYFLSTFVDRYPQLMGALVKVEKPDGVVTIKCTTRDLLSDFRLLAKFLGMRCPWLNERQLGTRIVDAEETLNRAGWFRRAYISAGRVKYEFTLVTNDRRSSDRRKEGSDEKGS